MAERRQCVSVCCERCAVLLFGFEEQAVRVFENIKAITEAAGGSMNDIAKLSILMADLSHFATVNEVMARYFDEPYPARAAYEVKALPKAVDIEIEAIMVVG